MTFAQFVCVVGSARQAQRKYLKTKDQRDLYKLRDAERAIDDAIEEIFAQNQVNQENSLLDSQNENTPRLEGGMPPPQEDCAF